MEDLIDSQTARLYAITQGIPPQKTPYDHIHKLDNEYCIKGSTLSSATFQESEN